MNVLGNIQVGDDMIVDANVVVITDIVDRDMAVGCPRFCQEAR